jgi:acetylornithine deacetylase/succinyl-diaminopimelate desuccinylase-like protein
MKTVAVSALAVVGVAKKGFWWVKLSVALEGGHSCTPAPEGSISVLSKALLAAKGNPMPIHVHGDVDRKRMHGTDERISESDARRAT